MKREIWLIGVVAVLFTVLGVYFASKSPQASPATPAPASADDHPLFSQSLPTPAGARQNLAQWRGKRLVVNFWATWCPPCVEEMPDLVALQNELGAKNVQVVGIGIDSAQAMQTFIDQHKISYPNYVAGMEGTELSKRLGNAKTGLPYTVLISPDGAIRKTYSGRLNMQELRTDLANL